MTGNYLRQPVDDVGPLGLMSWSQLNTKKHGYYNMIKIEIHKEEIQIQNVVEPSYKKIVKFH